MIEFPGGHRGRVPPVPIPNTEVKPATADGTACEGAWESRSLPGLVVQRPVGLDARFCLSMEAGVCFVRATSSGLVRHLARGTDRPLLGQAKTHATLRGLRVSAAGPAVLWTRTHEDSPAGKARQRS